MNKILVLAGIISLTFFASSCRHVKVKGEGATKTENRSVGSFSAIQLSAPLTATIKIDPTAAPSLQLNGYGNVLHKIKSEVNNNTLIVDKDGFLDFDIDKDVTATITVPSLSSLTISGAADADLDGDITGNEFTLKVSGAGDVKIQSIHTNTLTTTLSGAGSLTIDSGTVNYASYKVTGAGDVDAYDLQCRQAKTVVSGAGDINLSASEKLDVHISGAGSVKYKGKPVVSSDINGVGSLEAED